ncbi:HNH endonuclease [Streptomyces echinatus]|uniref:HNH endonuclease n=1 Tax=Streptomyces echinatus TaxID=67293 RepID=UPI003789AD44
MSSGVRYTREWLAEAATHCADIDEVIAFLGVRPYRNVRRHLYKCFERYGVDVSHFPRRRRAGEPPSRPAPEVLRRAVENATSIAGALRTLGHPCSGQLRTLFHQWVADDGLDTSHFLGQAHQRGRPSATAKRPEEVLVKHDGKNRTKTMVLRRALLAIGVPEMCAGCGVGGEWLGKSMTLEIDHVNGDWRDNRQENLRLLCPNCHAITSTWCRGGRRVVRGAQ